MVVMTRRFLMDAPHTYTPPPPSFPQCLKQPKGKDVSAKIMCVRARVGNPSHNGNVPSTNLLMQLVILLVHPCWCMQIHKCTYVVYFCTYVAAC